MLQSAEDTLKTVEYWLENDDVFSVDFLTETVIVPEHATFPFSDHVFDTSAGPWKPRNVLHATWLDQTGSSSVFASTGPFFLIGNALHQAWRLHTDDLDSFATTLIPRDERDGDS